MSNYSCKYFESAFELIKKNFIIIDMISFNIMYNKANYLHIKFCGLAHGLRTYMLLNESYKYIFCKVIYRISQILIHNYRYLYILRYIYHSNLVRKGFIKLINMYKILRSK